MKKRRMRWICLGLALMLLLPVLTPAGITVSADTVIYDVINADNVVLRTGPSTTQGSIAHFITGVVVIRLGETTGSDGYVWYKVQATVELASIGIVNRDGYVRSDLVRSITEQEKNNYINYGIHANGYTGTGMGTGTSTAGVVPTATPTPIGNTSYTDGQTLVVTVTSAYIRQSASTSSAYLTKLQNGATMTYLDKTTGTDGYVWYYVSVSGTLGYIRSDLVTGSSASSGSSATATPQATTLTQYTVNVSRNATLRKGPSTATDALALVPNGTVVTASANVTGADGYIWRYVTYNSLTGYIRSDLLKATSTVSVTPTPAPVTSTSYLYVSTDSAPLRASAGKDSTLLALMKTATLVKYVNSTTDSEGSQWHQVLYQDTTGYVLGSLTRAATTAELQEAGISVSATAAPSTSSGTTVTITGTRVNLRSAASTTSSILDVLVKGAKGTYVSQTTGSDGYVWYYATYSGLTGYVRSDLATASSSAGSTSTSETGADGSLTGLVAIRSSGTNIRTGMGTSFGLVEKLNRNDLVTILGKGTGSDGNVWYRVTTPSGKTGYVRGDLVRPLTDAEAKANNVTTSSSTTTTTYTSLKLGMTGTEVTKLQNALITLGYLSGSVTLGTYDTATYNAVKSFQSKYGLYVDGIAGTATQTKLYGLTSGSSSSSSSGSYNVSNCELNSWATGDIKAVLEANSSSIVVIDVATKKAFNVKYIWGANHADAEPLTTSDTATLNSIASGASNQYRIPVWVQAGGRTFAASMYPIAHDASSQTIKTNNFDGVFCLHFKDSKTHTNPDGSGTKEHQACVQAAYDAAH